MAQDYQTEIEAVPVVYESAKEVPAILAERVREADVWLFSGIAPYNYAVKSGIADRPLLYLPHTGSSLYRVLLQMTLQHGLSVEAISFDTFSDREIEEIFAEVVSSNVILAPSAEILDSSGKAVVPIGRSSYSDGLPALIEFSMPAGSTGFTLVLPGGKRVTQCVT